MPDLQVCFAEVIETLKAAQSALSDGIGLMVARDPDRAAVLGLLDIASNCADQAQTLVRFMTDSGADDTSLAEAHDLSAFFWATEDCLEAKLGLGRT